MDWPVKKSLASMAAVTIFSLIVMAIPGVHGAEIAIDMDSLSHTPANVTTDDQVTISVDIIFVGAEPAEDGVVLSYALCTEDSCSLDTREVMERVDDTDTWQATIGPFQSESSQGDPYVDIKFHFDVEGVATDGGDDPSATSDTEYIYFEEIQSDDDDDTSDDETDDEKEEDESPLGLEWAIPLIGLILVAFMVRKRS